MTVERELRSSKRQRIGSTGADVSFTNSDSLGQATDHKKQEVQSRVDDTPMLDHTTQECTFNKDSANASKSDGRKIHIEGSEEDRKERDNLGGDHSDATNGIIDAASFKKEKQMGSNDGSNEKLADTLLSLKGMNVSASNFGPLPKSDGNQLPNFDLSERPTHLEPVSCKGKSYEVDEIHRIEMGLLHKLEKYIHAYGGSIGDGWKIQAAKRNKNIYKSYISPDGRRFRSMKEVGRFLGVLPSMKGFTCLEEDLDNTEPKVDSGNGSVYLNTVVTQPQQITADLAVNQVHKENSKREPFAKISPKVKGSWKRQEIPAPLIMDHGPKQGCNSSVRLLVEAEMQPSSRLSTTGMKGKSLPNTTKPPYGHEGTTDMQQRHWAEILEKVKTSNMNVVGIGSCILSALASEPPEWVREMLQHLVAKDVSKATGSVSLKEAVLSVLARYHGEEVNHEQAAEDSIHGKSDRIEDKSKAEETMLANESGRKNTVPKALPSTEMITECCRNVLQDIISAEQFAVLCNLIHGSFGGSRTHEVFDFRLIDLRMNAGTYGMSPGLFDSDMQQIWKRVREIGQEMVVLADSLTQSSQASYKKQVATLLEGDFEESPKVDCANMTLKANTNIEAMEQEVLDEQPQELIDCYDSGKQNAKMQILRAEDGYDSLCTTTINLETDAHRKKIVEESDLKDFNGMPKNVLGLGRETKLSMKNMEGGGNGHLECDEGSLPNVREMASSGIQGLCKSCGRNEHNDCIILCNTCEGAYHTYCLLPALEEIPSCSWYCSSCSGPGKEPSEVHSFSDRKENGVDKENAENVVHHCVASEQLCGQMAPHGNRENDGPDIDREQVKFLNARKEAGLNSDAEVLKLDGNTEECDLCGSGEGMEEHAGRQEVELHEDEPTIEKLCKICHTGKKDDDDLIECSNANCFYIFYHLRCLRPPLASIPPPTWYCPSCLCRSCFIDENDAEIILCDGCDDGYHTYCLKPPLVVIPKSHWYCPSCLEKQKRKKGKKGLNPITSKSAGRARSKKGSQLGSPPPLHLGMGAANEPSERNMGPLGRIRSKKASKAASPSLHTGRVLHDLSDKNVDHEVGDAALDLQSKKSSRSASSAMEEDTVREAPSDGSDGVTEKFMVRVRSKQTSKFVIGMESKETGKRKRKCSEPRRSQV